MSELEPLAAVKLNFAHLESERDAPDLEKLDMLLYEAIHRSGHHPSAWFAAFMCYRRTSQWRKAQWCWQQACEQGDVTEFIRLAARYH